MILLNGINTHRKKNNEINIMFVIGDITKAAKPNPEIAITDGIKGEK